MSRRANHPIVRAVVVALVTSCACGHDPDAAGGMLGGDAAATPDDTQVAQDAGMRSCEVIVEEILLTCGNIVCHDPFSGGIGTSLDLSDQAVLPDSLLGLTATEECGQLPYVDTEDPQRSLLLQKLEDVPPCGERMPAGARPALTTGQKACFAQWVAAAAAKSWN